jgi:hypothetical protein
VCDCDALVDGWGDEASEAVTRPSRAGKDFGRRWVRGSNVRLRWMENSGPEKVDGE